MNVIYINTVKKKKSHTAFVGLATDTHGRLELKAQLTADFSWTEVCVAFCSERKYNNDKCDNVIIIVKYF